MAVFHGLSGGKIWQVWSVVPGPAFPPGTPPTTPASVATAPPLDPEDVEPDAPPELAPEDEPAPPPSSPGAPFEPLLLPQPVGATSEAMAAIPRTPNEQRPLRSAMVRA